MARKVGGLSMAEGLVALGVLAMASVFLISLVPSSGKAIAHAEEQVLAANLAQSQLERLRGEGFSRLPAGTRPAERVELERMAFTYTIEVNYLPDCSQELLKSVQVHVEWGDPVQHKTLEAWVGNVSK